MRWMLGIATALAGAGLALPALAQTPPAAAPAPAPPAAGTPAPDYSQDAVWLCRPGHAGACAVDLNALSVEANGTRTPQVFQAAADPQIDCFYVYPTISNDPTPLSDLTPGPEEARVVRGQFARLASRCRLFAPVYRQISNAGLAASMRGDASGRAISFETPYADVRAAWRDYLTRDNGGRGVVVIGHSQGAILLQRLLREEIDGQPAQRLLVGAYLAGDPTFTVAEGRDAGGSLPTIPLCRTPQQFGCVYAWSTYLAGDTANPRFFGRSVQAGRVAPCVSPAAPAGGSATLRGYFSRPAGASETDPPFVENASGITGECVADAQGSVLRVTVTPGTVLAPILTAALQRAQPIPGWGLHPIDVSLVMGDIERAVGEQGRWWQATHHPARR